MKKPVIYLLVGVVALVTVGTYVVASNSKSSEEDTTKATEDQDEGGLATQVPDEQPPSDPISVPTETPVEDPDVAEPEIKWATFTHPDLPGFSMQYPESWDVVVKPFLQDDSVGFESIYDSTGECYHGCMGVRFQHEDIKMDMMFDLIVDDYGTICSDTEEYKMIDSEWYRVYGADGYYYSKNIIENELVDHPEWGYETDTGEEAVKDKVYGICDHLTGNKLINDPLTELSEEGRILLEKPRVIGMPSGSLLQILDQVIISIEGVESRPAWMNE